MQCWPWADWVNSPPATAPGWCGPRTASKRKSRSSWIRFSTTAIPSKICPCGPATFWWFRKRDFDAEGLVMKQQLDRIIEEIRGAWRFRWIALSAAAAVALIGWTIVFALPDRYAADARVFVDTRTALKPALQGLTTD